MRDSKKGNSEDSSPLPSPSGNRRSWFEQQKDLVAEQAARMVAQTQNRSKQQLAEKDRTIELLKKDHLARLGKITAKAQAHIDLVTEDAESQIKFAETQLHQAQKLQRETNTQLQHKTRENCAISEQLRQLLASKAHHESLSTESDRKFKQALNEKKKLSKQVEESTQSLEHSEQQLQQLRKTHNKQRQESRDIQQELLRLQIELSQVHDQAKLEHEHARKQATAEQQRITEKLLLVEKRANYRIQDAEEIAQQARTEAESLSDECRDEQAMIDAIKHNHRVMIKQLHDNHEQQQRNQLAELASHTAQMEQRTSDAERDAVTEIQFAKAQLAKSSHEYLSERKEAVAELEQLRRELRSLHAEHDAQTAAQLEVSAEVAELESGLQQAQAQLKESESRHDEQLARATKNFELSAHQTASSKLHNQLGNLEHEIAEQDAQHAESLEQNNAHHLAQRKEAVAELEQLRRELRSLHAEHDAQTDAQIEVSAEVADLEIGLKQAQARLKESESHHAEQLANTAQRYGLTIEQTQQQLSTHQSERATLQRELGTLQHEMADHDEQHALTLEQYWHAHQLQLNAAASAHSEHLAKLTREHELSTASHTARLAHAEQTHQNQVAAIIGKSDDKIGEIDAKMQELMRRTEAVESQNTAIHAEAQRARQQAQLAELQLSKLKQQAAPLAHKPISRFQSLWRQVQHRKKAKQRTNASNRIQQAWRKHHVPPTQQSLRIDSPNQHNSWHQWQAGSDVPQWLSQHIDSDVFIEQSEGSGLVFSDEFAHAKPIAIEYKNLDNKPGTMQVTENSLEFNVNTDKLCNIELKDAIEHLHLALAAIPVDRDKSDQLSDYTISSCYSEAVIDALRAYVERSIRNQPTWKDVHVEYITQSNQTVAAKTDKHIGEPTTPTLHLRR